MLRLWTALLGIALAAAVVPAALAEKPVDKEVEVEPRDGTAAETGFEAYEEVDAIPAFSRLHGFTAIDRDSVLIWRTSRDPYLVELRRESFGLGFANAIGFTSWGSRIHAGFDDLIVDGMRYPIEKIYRLTREQAKALESAS